MLIKQISIFVENKKGRMAEITRLIGEARVDIRALSVADTSDFGILRLIVDKPDDAIKSLREAGLTVSLTDVVAVGIDDKPGAFARAVQILSDADINIEYMYAFISRSQGRAYVIMRLEDTQRAMEVLEKNGIEMPKAEEIYNM